MSFKHTPAMLKEVLDALEPGPGKIMVDCTLGGSGHARAILERIIPGGTLVGLDRDKDAIENAKKVLLHQNADVRLFNENFSRLSRVLEQCGIEKADGILADFGVSQYQLEQSGRGFSFMRDEPLDMRMGVDCEKTAEEIINQEDESGLANIFFEYGEERWSRRIARAIVRERKRAPIRTSRRLAELILDAMPKKARLGHQRIHPATRTFMGLRIAVNRELEHIEKFMDRVADLLAPGGRLCVLSFHSLEDRIVKHRIRLLEKGCTCPPSFPKCVCDGERKFRSLSKKPQRPTDGEISSNPMSRSTRLRAAERV